MAMGKTEKVALTVTVFVMVFVLVTGQLAYGNVYGHLFNDSKVPKIRVMQAYGYTASGVTYAFLNISDVAGPDAYPASVTMLSLSNESYHLTLYAPNISNSVVGIIQAKWNLARKGYSNYYSGLVIPLGAEAVFQLRLPSLTPGEYTLTLYMSAVPPVSVGLPITAGVPAAGTQG